MFFILRLILIILINKTYAYVTQDSEIILLPTWNLTGAKKIPLTLKAFGKYILLNDLRRNDQTALLAYEVWKYNITGITEKLLKLKASDSCFYLYENHVSFAIINLCQENGLEGLVFVENNILEIRPLQNIFIPFFFIDDFCVREQINISFGKPHLIKRSLRYFTNSDHLHKIRSKRFVEKKRPKIKKKPMSFNIELAVFVDAEAYSKFMPHLNNDIKKMRKMMLEYVSYIQTFFHHPSLGVRINISLVRLDIIDKQPKNFQILTGDYDVLTYLFCKYAKALNPPNDNDLLHWDIGLYITAIDLYKSVSMNTLDYNVTGKGYYNGACNPYFSCAIVEFFPHQIESSGIRSSLNAVYEIGHLLGLRDDGKKEDIVDDVYIMSPVRPYHGVNTWSPSSQNMIKKLLPKKSCLRDRQNFDLQNKTNIYDDNKNNDKNNNDDDDDNGLFIYEFDNLLYYDMPGKEQTAKAQCELLLSDVDANVVTLHDICENLQCETPHKNKPYFAGPALNGTHCALGKECYERECVPVDELPYVFKYCEKDNWSEWKEESCKSSCLMKSKGALIKRRYCEHWTNRTANCTGLYYDVVLCNDSILCIKNRITIDEFTTIKCTEFSKVAWKANLAVQLTRGSGYQFPHNVERPWVACTIFCREKETSLYYPPRQEMLDNNVDPYFPDGTWCYKKDGQDYYCRQHYCLPENYSFDEDKKFEELLSGHQYKKNPEK